MLLIVHDVEVSGWTVTVLKGSNSTNSEVQLKTQRCTFVLSFPSAYKFEWQ